MTDKFGWTEPLHLERGAVETVMVPARRGTHLGPALDGLRRRIGIVTGRQAWSVDETTMTDARSRVNGGGRHACGLDGGGSHCFFILNGTAGVRSKPSSVGTALKPGLAMGFRGFRIKHEHTYDQFHHRYSNGATTNAQFALVAAEMPRAILQ